MAAHGLGGQDRFGAGASIVHSGRRHMCHFSDSEAVGDLVSDGADGVVLAGCPSGLVTASSPGGVDSAFDLVW